MSGMIFRFLLIVFLYLFPCTLLAQRVDRLISNRDYPAAIELLEKEIMSNPSADLHHKKGTVYIKLMEHEKAFESFKAAYQLDSTYIPALEDLAEMSTSMGNYHGTAFYYRKVVQLAPDELYWRGKLAVGYINLKDYNKAFELYNNIWEQDSTSNYYKKNYALSAYRINERSLAIKLYEELADLHYPDINVYLNLTSIYSSIYLSEKDEEKKEKAINACLSGLVVFPNHPSLILKLADTWFQFREYKNAQLIYEELISKDKPSLETMRNYGICLYINEEEEKSLNVLKQCIDDGLTKDPIVYFYLGMNYRKNRMVKESIYYYNMAIDVATPDYYGDFYHYLGQAYNSDRDYENAAKCLIRAIELYPENFDLLFEIAMIYDKHLKKTLALNYYQNYLERSGKAAMNEEYVKMRINNLKKEIESK